MLQTPMLQSAAQPPVVTTEATIVTPITDAHEALEAKKTSLRRAATALLVFAMSCARPCPSSWGAWLGIAAAFAVLCSSSHKLLCRSRVARFLSAFTAIFAGYTLFSLVMAYRAGMPLQISAKVHSQCDTMPKETFVWAKDMLSEHPRLHKGVSFLARHMPTDSSPTSSQLISSDMNASSLPAVVAGSVDPAMWSQSEACDKVAHFVACFAKMMTIGSALAHLFLLLSAVAVVKRACRLRCAAYRAGLLKWKCCKSACKRTESAQIIVKPAPANTKELA